MKHLLTLVLLLPLGLLAQNFEHPRGFITKAEVAKIRERVTRKPYSEVVKVLQAQLATLEQDNNPDEHGFVARAHAYQFIITGQKKHADKAFQFLQKRLAPSEQDKVSHVASGLSWASDLKSGAMVYDLCYPGWSDKQRKRANDLVEVQMRKVAGSMGPHANYALESNWMGIRFSSVLMASLVLDDWAYREEQKTKYQPFEWMAGNHLKQHIDRNLFRNGWNSESLGYHNYLWQFISPAIICIQNARPDYHPSFTLQNFAPKAMNSVKAQAIVGVNIYVKEGRQSVHTDLSDDQLGYNPVNLIFDLRLYPLELRPYIKWLVDYHYKEGFYTNYRSNLFYYLAFYDDKLEAKNPAEIGWLRYQDPEQGVVALRDRYQDSEDFVVVHSAAETRVKGHSSYDSNTFRIIGLGNVWAIGAGRTGEVGGATALFPTSAPELLKPENELGKLLSYEYTEAGGYSIVEGSSMEVQKHVRKITTDFSQKEGKAVVMVQDQSVNGKLWQMASPWWNEATVQGNEIHLKGPNNTQAKLVAFLPGGQEAKGHLDSTRYNGKKAQRLQGDLCIYENCHHMANLLRFDCKGAITVVMVFGKQGEELPAVAYDKESNKIRVGQAEYTSLIYGR